MSLFRIFFYLLLAVFAISLIRGVIGAFARTFGDLMRPAPQPRQTAGASRDQIPLAGELKKDPVCGTYTSAATSIKQTIGKETFYFCSPQCRDKYAASH